MSQPFAEKAAVGLCLSCRHVKLVGTDRGSVFYQCQRAATDSSFAKYPRLPVLRCNGYEPNLEPQEDAGKGSDSQG